MRRALVLGGLALTLHLPADLTAQSASATPQGPGIVIMRSYACGTANVDSASGILVDTWGAEANAVIREGLLLDYQVLKRVWGDEWNLIEMFVATDEDAFRYAYEEIELRLQVSGSANLSRRQSFSTLCPRRKDSQYSVVISPF